MGPNDIIVPGVEAKKLIVIVLSILVFLFQWKNKNLNLFTIGSVGKTSIPATDFFASSGRLGGGEGVRVHYIKR